MKFGDLQAQKVKDIMQPSSMTVTIDVKGAEPIISQNLKSSSVRTLLEEPFLGTEMAIAENFITVCTS